MSCWMVEDKTINQIVAFIAAGEPYGAPHRWVENLKRAHDRYQLGPFNLETGRRDRWAELGCEMHLMNRAAVEKRYEGREKIAPYAYHMVKAPGPIDAHKLLTCYLYQCSEGDSIGTLELYRNLEKTLQHVGYGIIQALPEWNAADCWR